MNEFPVQVAKVQRPPLRAETLARHRLLDWLHVKIHSRVVLILADAGYGKTTLLADFSGRTRLRTLWYRLDEDDRDWVTILHHLVAAGREHDPGFAPATAAMLADRGVTGPARDAVVGAFIRELEDICEHGAVLILDDFHLVDEAPDARLLARELVTRAPERLTIVFASRRQPMLPIAKLRAAGEVAELSTDDLRFDADETARLFTETYNRKLDADVLADLSARTEGWAASLQLVQAALRDRSPVEIRRFVRELTGADHELYDYLAEEVVGDLPQELQEFLMRTSILQAVTPELAAVVTDRSPDDTRRLMALAERLSLLSRRGRTNRELRYHPLVRDFLEARLAKNERLDIHALHLDVARFAESHDWRLACHHFVEAGHASSVGDVIDRSIEEIVAKGAAPTADAFLMTAGLSSDRPSFAVVRSRSELRRGNREDALRWATAASEADSPSPIALSNLASIAYSVGDIPTALVAAKRLIALPTPTELKAIGEGIAALVESSLNGDIRKAIRRLESLRQEHQSRGYDHYQGITMLNIAVLQRANGNAAASLEAATSAMDLLEATSGDSDLTPVQCVRSWAMAHAGAAEFRQVLTSALAEASGMTRLEALIEAAEIETDYGSAERASDLLDEASGLVSDHPWLEPLYSATRCQLSLRTGDLSGSRAIAESFDIDTPTVALAHRARQLALQAAVAVMAGDLDAETRCLQASEHARSTGSGHWQHYNEVSLAAVRGAAALNACVRRLSHDPAYLSIRAEMVAPALHLLEHDELRSVGSEAQSRPVRWLQALRSEVDERTRAASRAASLLDEMGEQQDVLRLRRFSDQSRPGLGRKLARRLAPRVFVEDQGKVTIQVGDRALEGTSVRRKVLALLCFLVTRPSFSATRDEVLDALWPDADPAVALNSLNQTIYFLRRVFEPEYNEQVSPGYIRHESDVVWLDSELVGSRSQLCQATIRSLPLNPTPDQVSQLIDLYRGPFALDFAYEEWANAYRDGLHTTYLQVVERAVAADTASGHFDRGILVARRAIQTDPTAEQIELSLVRLYRLSGSHAAAAEQYAHYAAVLRDSLGVEPPPLEAI